MKIVLVTGAAGLVGSEAVRFFSGQGFKVVGIDNDMRQYFFGREGSTGDSLQALKGVCEGFVNHAVDIRDAAAVNRIFEEYGADIDLVVHTAAQPSHDWAAREPATDFGVNALGTLNLLESVRQYCPGAVFIFTSTNKVYGDRVNGLPLMELETRWELDPQHPCFQGIDESMSLDQCKHSLFGVSKLAADILTQEYGRYFGMKTVVFRGGCLTGPCHAGVSQHGYLSYLMRCAMNGQEYQIIGYKGKQVRDNIHSHDLVRAFYQCYQKPRSGEVYNIGGSRYSHCSLIESIGLCEKITGKKMRTVYVDTPRSGDHIWWISDMSKFSGHYPEWRITRDVESILAEMCVYHQSSGMSGA
ncbi:MAG: NAD-dependent epimerase/dehydratase family protein [Candidatus Omnitrophota bacterium]